MLCLVKQALLRNWQMIKLQLPWCRLTGEDIKMTNTSNTSPAGLGIQGVAADGVTTAGGAVAFVGNASLTVGGSVSFYSSKGFTVGSEDTTIVAIDTAPASSTLESVGTVDVSTQAGL